MTAEEIKAEQKDLEGESYEDYLDRQEYIREEKTK